MGLQVGFLVGAVIADIASEYLQSRVDQFVASYVHRAAKRLAALVATESPIDVM